MDRQNLTLLTDLYELTMMQGYFKNKDRNETVIFDAFYRSNPCGGGYAIMAGFKQMSKPCGCATKLPPLCKVFEPGKKHLLPLYRYG